MGNLPPLRSKQVAAPPHPDKFSFQHLQGLIQVLRCIDGDTIEFILEVPLQYLVETNAIQIRRGKKDHHKTVIALKLHGRLVGINAPEKNTEQGPKSTNRLQSICHDHCNLLYGVCGKQDKYGRTLITLYHSYDTPKTFDNSINYQMIEEGFAVAYKC